jgi:microcystin-dependent protein
LKCNTNEIKQQCLFLQQISVLLHSIFFFLKEVSMPIGMIVATLAAQAPSGWLICDGSAVSTTEYGGLFAVVGDLYGAGNNAGNGTFNVPNLTNTFIRGLDVPPTGRDPDIASRTAMVPGTTLAGPNIGSLQAAQVGSHSHNLSGFCNVDTSNFCCTQGYLPDSDPQDNWGETGSAGFSDGFPKHFVVNFMIQATA